MSEPRSPPERNSIVLVVTRPIARSDIPGLCERVRAVLESSDADLIVCDMEGLVDPDAVAVDALARLQLTARRCGRRVRLRHPCGELRELLALMGLSDVVPLSAGLALESRGEAEEREPARGIEEESDPADPTG